MIEMERAREALTFIPASCERETWFRVLAAIKSGLGEDGRDLADEWSQDAPDSYSASNFASAWRSIQEGGGITVATLYGMAKEHGWTPQHNGQRVMPSPEDLARREAARKAEAERQAARAAAAALKAQEAWTAGTRGAHPYWERKGVKATATTKAIRVEQLAGILGYEPVSDGVKLDGWILLLPIKVDGALSSLELIDEAGRKSALAGGRKSGGYWSPGKLPEGDGEGLTIQVAEGAATALSAFEAMAHPTIAALSSHNLKPAALKMRARYPRGRIVILADTGNGEVQAHEAATAVDGFVATPDFGTERPEGAKDWNDMHSLKGLEAVRVGLEAAQRPGTLPTPQPATENRPGAILAAPTNPEWPAPLAPEAFQGLAGEIVRFIEPHTESDPAAILLQAIVAFGALVGRGPHVAVEGSEHHANLFAVVVGRSSKARKGTSWGRILALFRPITNWPRVVDGLSSGEGLKYAVRDPVRKQEKDKAGYVTEVEIDAGVADKRVLVVESEFAQVLRQCARPGNTLSATVRSAWDSGNLQTLTKNDPTTATGAHVCMIGHITVDEIRAELTATDSANGFANRFILMAAERSKHLPFGGDDLDPERQHQLSDRIAEAVRIAQSRKAMRFDSEAREVWRGIYPVLSEGHPGLLGAVTARAEAQTLRLALLFALMDRAQDIETQHLQAALSVWERAEESARFVFGSAIGDRIADAILRALRASGQRGMTRTQISQIFNKNETAERIAAGLALLDSRGLARHRKAEGSGRPSEIWEAA